MRKESKDFGRVGRILDYELQLRGEKGEGGWEKTRTTSDRETTTMSEEELRIELPKDKEVRVDLTRDAPV